jgi:adenine-specific DNA-methyltransferase
MTSNGISLGWGRRFGLASVPLFEAGEIEAPNQHAVLLDGGNGSFILSQGLVNSDTRSFASWAWSSGLGHHVGIAGDTVLVTRWDKPEAAEKFTLRSVTERLDAFYSYLSLQRVSGRPDVVATLVDLFRAVRGEVETQKASPDIAVAEFLSILAQLIGSERLSRGSSQPGFDQLWTVVQPAVAESVVTQSSRQRLEAGFKQQITSLLNLDLSVVLAIRHAASPIFQEAHFAFSGSVQGNLFGYQPASSTRRVTRGAHHFTPPPLARSIVEQVLLAIPDLRNRHALVVCDPACGSGAFLTETARTLRRIGFYGKLTLIGRDLSPAAVLMARFAVEASKMDWQPRGGTEIDIQVADSLRSDRLPSADVIVMNPPFLAWPMMDRDLREIVSAILGRAARHRPDLSMAFITRAMGAVRKGGIVASLLPSSILSLYSAREWRRDLLERGRLAFLGSFGEYGLFVHALVQVAAIVLVAGDEGDTGLGLSSANEAVATGEALRALRRLEGAPVTGVNGRGWRITKIDKRDLVDADRWRMLPVAVEQSLTRLNEIGMPHVENMFDVRQGILTGMNEVFILSAEQAHALPSDEQRYFRPALFRDAIASGRIRERFFVFFPYDERGPIFANRGDLVDSVPQYFRNYLAPHEIALRKRSGVAEQWWLLSRYYGWVNRRDPRILSKYFGASGDFAIDERAIFIPLQGYAWFLKGHRGGRMPDLKEYEIHILRAYYTLLNSPTFTKLLKVLSDPVSGGQSNLSVRFVNPIPLADLTALENSTLLGDLSVLAIAEDLLSLRWLELADQLAERAWGPELTAALREMDNG